MSDGTKTRRIDFILGAKDEASRVVKEATARMKKDLADASKSIPLATSASDRVALAFPKPNRSAEEQQIRDMMAGRYRAMRDAAKRANLQEEVNRRLFGDPAPEQPKFDPTSAEGMAAFGRSEVSAKGRQMAKGGGEKDWYKSLKSQMDTFENIGKLVRGVGALGVVSEVGRAMQRLPEIQNQYYENLRSGMSRTQAFATSLADAVPVVGELAKGFRGLWDALTTTAVDAKLRALKEDKLDQKAAREAQRDRNNARKAAIMGEADVADRDSRRRRALSLATGADKDRLQAQFDYEDKIRAADALYAKAPSASTDSKEQDKVRNAARQQRLAAEQEYRQKLKEIDDKFNQQAYQADGEFRRQAEQTDRETEDSKLERAGRGIEARKAQRKREFDEIESELRARQSKALEGLDPNDPRFGMVTKAFDRAMQANQQRRAEAEAAANQADAQDLADYRRGNRNTNMQGDASIAGRRARLEGRTRDADEISRKAQLQSQLDEIDRKATEEKRQHAERSAEIDAQARKDATRALEESALTAVEQARERARQYRQEDDKLFRGDTRLLTGRGDSRGASDPAIKMAKDTGTAVAEALKTQLSKLDGLKDVVSAIEALSRKLGVVTA